MWDTRNINRCKIDALAAILFSAVFAASAPATATDFTAGVVLTEMEDADRYPYLAGIVEGLAYARYKQAGKDPESMACVYDWFYESGTATDQIYAAFARFEKHTPGAVMAALIERRCGR